MIAIPHLLQMDDDVDDRYCQCQPSTSVGDDDRNVMSAAHNSRVGQMKSAHRHPASMRSPVPHRFTLFVFVLSLCISLICASDAYRELLTEYNTDFDAQSTFADADGECCVQHSLLCRI